jgi:Cytotoxic translational repressor of toxin-antitoxin stability system
MRFRLTSEAKKYLDSLDKDSVNRIYEALRKLTKEPPSGDVKELQGAKGIYRLRVGDIRILFEKTDNYVIINKISPRGQAYK